MPYSREVKYLHAYNLLNFLSFQEITCQEGDRTGFNNSLYVLPKKFFLKIVLEVQLCTKEELLFLK